MEPEVIQIKERIKYPANIKNRIIFRVQGQEFQVNSKLLARQPEVLKALFSFDLNEPRLDVVELPERNAELFKYVMDKIHIPKTLQPKDFSYHFVPAQSENRGKAIILVEGQEFRVDKEELSIRSKYFNTLFSLYLPKREKGPIALEDISALQFKRLLDFILNGWSLDDYGIMVFPTLIRHYSETMRNRILDGFVLRCGDDPFTKVKENRINHIKGYWNNNGEMLKMVKRVGIKESFKKYFHKKLELFACQTDDCIVCLTSYIFCLVYTKYIKKLDKKYTPEFIKEWFNLAKEVGICTERLEAIGTMVFQKAKNRLNC